MTPEFYEAAQKKFLELRSKSLADQSIVLQALRRESPDLHAFVEQLLQADRAAEASPGESDDATAVSSDEIQSLVHPAERAPTIVPEHPVRDRSTLPQSVGPYRILEKIGEGGNGVVYMAEQTQPFRRRVAVKCIRPGQESAGVIARFEAERQAIALMNHPSIARIFDAGVTEAGQPWFAMELVRGLPVDQFCNEHGLSVTSRLELFQQACDAVHDAHRRGVIHRDLKPANILVTLSAGKPLVKVIDFGIAKALHLSLTEKTLFTGFGQLVGTLEYMSPEQCALSDSEADVRSDVYSLGVLLYQLLTGRTPRSREELLARGLWGLPGILRDSHPDSPSRGLTQETKRLSWLPDEPSKSRWISSIQGDLDQITLKAISPDPAQRYDSPLDLSRDITRYLNHEPITARSPGLGYVMTRYIRRNRLAAATMAVIAVSLFVAAASVTWGYFQSQRNVVTLRETEAELRTESERLQIALQASEELRAIADESARKLSLNARRELSEAAWTATLKGRVRQSAEILDAVPEPYRNGLWHVLANGRLDSADDLLVTASERFVRAACMSEDGRIGGKITSDNTLILHDLVAGREILRKRLSESLYSQVCLSSDHQSLLLGFRGRLELLDASGGRRLAAVNPGRGGIRAIRFDPRRRQWLVITGANYLLTLDANTLSVEAEQLLPGRARCFLPGPESGTESLRICGEGNVVYERSSAAHPFDSREFPASPLLALSAAEQPLEVLCIDGEVYSSTASLPVKESSADRLKDAEPDEPRRFEQAVAGRGGVLLVEQSTARLYFREHSGNRLTFIRRLNDVPLVVNYRAQQDDFILISRNGGISRVPADLLRFGNQRQPGPARLTAGAVLPAGTQAIVGDEDGGVCIYDAATGRFGVREQRHDGEILCLALSSHEPRLCTLGMDWTIRLSAPDDLRGDRSFPVAAGVRSVRFCEEGRTFLGPPLRRADGSFPPEGEFIRYTADTNEAITRFHGHTNWVMGFTELSDGKHIASFSVDGTLRVWETQSGAETGVADFSDIAPVTAICTLPESRVAAGLEDGSLVVLSRNGEWLGQRVYPVDTAIRSLFVPVGTNCLVLSCEDTRELTVLDVDTLEVLAKLELPGAAISHLITDPTAAVAAIRQDDGEIRIWHFRTGR